MRTVPKPWGHELIFAENERYAGKILHLEPGHSLSLQYHERKDETLYVLRGEVSLSVEVGGEMKEMRLSEGSSYRIRPGVRHRMRADAPEMPVLFLTARDAVEDRVAGLTAGGDDYVTKPFSLEEVIARIRAVLRRTRGDGVEPTPRLTFADLELDEESHEVWRGGEQIQLSPTEFKLLAFFMENSGRVLSRQQLLDAKDALQDVFLRAHGALRASAVRGDGLVKFRGIYVGLAAGQQNAVTACNYLLQFTPSLIEWNTNGYAAGEFDGAFVLRNRALSVLEIG